MASTKKNPTKAPTFLMGTIEMPGQKHPSDGMNKQGMHGSKLGNKKSGKR